MIRFLKEACVENLSQVLNAQKLGADRVELCDRLDLDGITPPRELIRASKESGLPVRVMIRPRGGNFQYTRKELEEMADTIRFCKEVGVEGVVFGIKKNDGNLNYEQIEQLAKIAHPLKVVIHKAIDETPDLVDSVKQLKKIPEVTAILTSGGMATADEGRETLKKMLEVAGDTLEIVVAGKVTVRNIAELHDFLQAPAYHGKLIVGALS